MAPLISHYGYCSRTRLIISLLITYIISAYIYIFSPFSIPHELYISLTILILLPMLIGRIREGGLQWYWLPLSLLSIFPIFATEIIIETVQNYFSLDLSRKKNLLMMIGTALTFSIITSYIFWLILGRNHFFRLLLVSTPITAPFWFLHRTLLKKPKKAVLSNDINRLKIPYKKIYFTLQGRLSREEYWLYSIIPWGFLFIIISVFNIYKEYDFSYIYLFISIISFILTLIGLVFSFAVFVKRLHDLNKTAWSILLLLIPVVGVIYLCVITTFERGNRKINRFGHPIDNGELLSIYKNINNRINEMIQKHWFKRFVIITIAAVTALFIFNTYKLSINDFVIYNKFFILKYDFLSSFAGGNFVRVETIIHISFIFLAITYLKRDMKIKLGIIGLILSGTAYVLFAMADSFEKSYNSICYTKLVFFILLSIFLLFAGLINNKSYLFSMGFILTFQSVCFFILNLEDVINYHDLKYLDYYIAALQSGIFLILLSRFMSKVSKSRTSQKVLINNTN